PRYERSRPPAPLCRRPTRDRSIADALAYALDNQVESRRPQHTGTGCPSPALNLLGSHGKVVRPTRPAYRTRLEDPARAVRDDGFPGADAGLPSPRPALYHVRCSTADQRLDDCSPKLARSQRSHERTNDG